MCPDINSLPPSRSPSASPRQRRTSSLLDTLAPQTLSSAGQSNSTSSSLNNPSSSSTMTSEPPHRHHPATVSERRRSGNLHINSSLISSGEPGTGDASSPPEHRSSIGHGPNRGGSPVNPVIGDPHHHHRTPSLGELHQELEQEQEAQVVRYCSIFGRSGRSLTLWLEPTPANHSKPTSSTSVPRAAASAAVCSRRYSV